MRKKSLLLSILIFLGIATNVASAQERTLTGKITDKAGSLPGVSVLLKGTTSGVVTNDDGTYSIALPKADATLIYSFIGYTTQEIVVGASATTMDVILKEEDKNLTEIVVTALGVKKEFRKIGYASTEIKGADLVKARDANPINSLIGRVSGLDVGGSAEMFGRPQLVLRGSTDLLYVVDGVPINSDTWNISPDDIESYTVLKGPNAAALYGSRGINGAIIMTTKRGTKDKKGWTIDFNSTTSVQTGFLTEPESQTEYGRGSNFVYSYGDRLYDNAQRLQEYGPRFDGQPVKQYDSPYDPTTGIRTATPWLARGANNFHTFMETGVISTNNIALSSAGENYDIRTSFSHTYQKGQAPNTSLYFDNVSLTSGYNFNKQLRAEASVNVSLQTSPNIPDSDYGPNSYVYMFKVYGSSDYDINDLKDIYKGPTGVNGLTQYAPEYGRLNSAWFMAKKWLRSHDKTDVFGQIKLSYKINDDFNVSLRTQQTTWSLLRTEQVPASANLNTYLPWYSFGWYGDFREDRRNLNENNTDILASYNKQISDWGLGVNVGASTRNFSYNSTWGTTKALALPNVYTLSNSVSPALSYSYNAKMQTYSGYYNVDLSYKNYFNINTTGRLENLSTLPAGSNTFFYPSVSISSVISQYAKLGDALSFLKLRASFADVKGALTSASIGSAYNAVTGNGLGNLLGYGTEYQSSYDGPSYANQNQYSLGSYYNGTTAVSYSNTVANPNIKPYDRTSYEGGVDAKFFGNRLGFDFTYFYQINGPNIFADGVAPSTGYYGINQNGLTTNKKGFEISLNGSPIKNPNGFSWDIGAVYSTYNETLKDIYNGEKSIFLNGHNYVVGDRLDDYYGTKFVRDGSGNIVNTSGGLPQQAPVLADGSNRGLIGHLNPDFSFGINNRFSYKSVSISFQFDGRVGGKIYNRVAYQGNNGGTSLASASGDFGVARLAEWNSYKTNGKVTPAYLGQGVTITGGTPKYVNGQLSNLGELTFAPNTNPVTVQSYLSSGVGANFDEYYMIDRTFAKLREIQIAYNFPTEWLKGKGISRASISLVGRNLLYFAATKDFDIEQYASGFNFTDKSLTGTFPDLQTPVARSYGVNLNVTF